MGQASQEQPEERLDIFQFGIILLSVYVLAVVAVQTFVELAPETDSLLNKIDAGICFIFLGDFFHRLYKAPSKLHFLKWGWIDFISSIPMFDQLRWGRAVRIVKLLRILRAFRSTKILLGVLFRHRVKSTFTAVVLSALVLMIFSSLAMLNLETAPESNIKTAGDAIWWAYTTITTVGYGDKYPVTTEGRIIAVILMTAGVCLFGTFTALVASFFLGVEQKKEQSEIRELIEEVRLLRAEVKKLDRNN